MEQLSSGLSITEYTNVNIVIKQIKIAVLV